MNEIIEGNCLEVMKQWDPETIDLVVTSPPYDDLRVYQGYEFDYRPIIRELFRLLRPGGVVVWVIGDSTKNGGESGSSFKQALYFMETGFLLHDTMIYRKNGPAYPSTTRYYQVFEYMFVFAKGKPKTFNPIKDRKNKWYGEKWGKNRSRRNREGDLVVQDWYKNEGGEYGVRFNIWKYNVGHGYQGDKFCHEHPASFPEKLARDHILSWSNPGDLILDPMCGSGTTLKMAKETGRNWVGIDISPEYIELSKKRLEMVTPRMFT